MSEPELRDFIDADYASLGELWAATGVGNPARGDSLESINRTLAAGGRLLVLAAGGRVVASCWLTDDARRLYVHHMAVTPELQGKGLGGRLLAKAVEIAAEKRLQMKLEVHHGNARAMGLYKKYGFEFLGDYDLMVRRKIG